MIISYPFLPARGADASDDDYEKSILDLEMLNAGVYPSSREREWHGGIHILAPTTIEPVRAIADGTLVAYRLNSELTKERPDDATGRIDNSFVLIRHETETDSITGNGGTENPVKVVFYSLYMHLMNTGEMKTRGINRQQVHVAVADSGQAVKMGNNAKIYRKDIIGFPGESYSTGGMIHFEIFTNSDDLNAFFVDSQNASEVGTKGTWGDSYFIVKAGSVAVASHPAGNTIGGHTFAAGQSGKVDTSKDLFVRIAFRNGTKYTSSWVDGEQDKAPTLLTTDEGVADADYEYAMYKIATALYPSCPSAGMELLRLGKVIGPDKDRLAPGESHNWQLVTFASGQQGYIDLADSNVVTQVLSDADFPHWLGWQKGIGGLFADSGQCDMHDLLDVLKVSHDGENSDASRQQLRDYFSDPEHRHLRDWSQKLVVQYPSEWDKANNARCTKLKEKDGLGPGRDGPYLGNDDEYSKHIQFVESLQWWADAGLGDSNVWHFHPFAFIKHFRKCGWLSLGELAQTVQGVHHRTIASVSALFVSELHDPHNAARVMRPAHLFAPLMRCMRKYGLVNASRRAHWFGQTLQETGTFQYMRELGDNAYFTNYYEGRCHSPVQRTINGHVQTLSPLGNCNPGDGPRFSGKGMIQITGGDNYRGYQAYRGGTNFTVDPGPELLITDAGNACDAGGYYWVSKQRYRNDPITHHLVPLGKASVNFWADKVDLSGLDNVQSANDAIDDVTRCVNTALDGRDNRRMYFKHAYSYLSDMVSGFPSDFHPLRD
ncbi:M23 family metallopeptidase [Burkholderia sp. 9120]|uniref:M23 family metallopeptidase n=1 Tax=Burkholderia sp. 9120 TaxID=1500897 RepID=UPI000558CCE3|nr:M23 family metallopeptidase [Burkholderia sp. 9120]